ncbi:Rv3235 family protein [Enteractinococcus coprophilus]|uniref:Uncharacterized protein n=1 Tax=Enteractinococcus coprophilus TaxID=1027633 RepID=A0A542ZZY3_9MICC|nr:Rv3235 family protein [Enteractinococcus coprophilus]TQL65903.1 hypothetical protein FB556_2378 [Enteractinococcus coprophilus]
MSTALHESSLPDEPDRTEKTRPAPSHLHALSEQQLQITPVSTLRATNARLVARLDDVPRDPVDEYEPSKSAEPRRLTRAFSARTTTSSPIADRRYRQQLASIKKMTQTIGAAFIEAELGIRPYMQLSAWIELELFHKLRARVEHSVNEKYLAARRGDEGSKKVPSIETLGVRASPKANGEWESSMTIRVGQRARAIAMRLQLHRNRWRVIAFEVG